MFESEPFTLKQHKKESHFIKNYIHQKRLVAPVDVFKQRSSDSRKERVNPEKINYETYEDSRTLQSENSSLIKRSFKRLNRSKSDSALFRTTKSTTTRIPRPRSLNTTDKMKSFNCELGNNTLVSGSVSDIHITSWDGTCEETEHNPVKSDCISSSVNMRLVNSFTEVQKELKNNVEETCCADKSPSCVIICKKPVSYSSRIWETPHPSYSEKDMKQNQSKKLKPLSSFRKNECIISGPLNFSLLSNSINSFQKSRVSQLKKKFDQNLDTVSNNEVFHNNPLAMHNINSRTSSSTMIQQTSKKCDTITIECSSKNEPKADTVPVTRGLKSQISFVKQAIMNYENLSHMCSECKSLQKSDIQTKSVENIHNQVSLKISRKITLIQAKKTNTSDNVEVSETQMPEEVNQNITKYPINLKTDVELQCSLQDIKPVSVTNNQHFSQFQHRSFANSSKFSYNLSGCDLGICSDIEGDNLIRNDNLQIFGPREEANGGEGNITTDDLANRTSELIKEQAGQGQSEQEGFSLKKNLYTADATNKLLTPLSKKQESIKESLYKNRLAGEAKCGSSNEKKLLPKPNTSFLWKHHDSFSCANVVNTVVAQDALYEDLADWYTKNDDTYENEDAIYMDAESVRPNCSVSSPECQRSECSSLGTNSDDVWIGTSKTDNISRKVNVRSVFGHGYICCLDGQKIQNIVYAKHVKAVGYLEECSPGKIEKENLKASFKRKEHGTEMNTEEEDSVMWNMVDDKECKSALAESDHLYGSIYQATLSNKVAIQERKTLFSFCSDPGTSRNTRKFQKYPPTRSNTIPNHEFTAEGNYHFIRRQTYTENDFLQKMPFNVRKKKEKNVVNLSENAPEKGSRKHLESFPKIMMLLQKTKALSMSRKTKKGSSTFYIKYSSDEILPEENIQYSTSASNLQHGLQQPKTFPPLLVSCASHFSPSSNNEIKLVDERKHCKEQDNSSTDEFNNKMLKELSLPDAVTEPIVFQVQCPSKEQTTSVKPSSCLEPILLSVECNPEIRFSEATLKLSTSGEGNAHENDLEFCTSSTVSQAMGSEDSLKTVDSTFVEEPLYQFYQKDIQKRATYMHKSEDSDLEEDIYSTIFNQSSNCETLNSSNAVGSSVCLRQISSGGRRTLWCELPEVIHSGLLKDISVQELKLQEAMFEIITSEASYLRSLDILVEHFMMCPELMSSTDCVLDRMEREYLFSDILPVKNVSQKLLADLEKRWKENLYMYDICDILYKYASSHFSVYVKYCTNNIYQERTFKQLKKSKPEFVQLLRRLEADPVCQNLDMHSFIILPVQRITRLPLLVDAIFQRLPEDSSKYETCKQTLAALNKVVSECNESARKMERIEEVMHLSRQFDFKLCKGIPLISSSRWLVKKGEVTRLLFEDSSKYTFGRAIRCTRTPIYLFLFLDLLIVTKKKSEENYTVLDYCPRNMVQVMFLEQSLNTQLPFNQEKNVFQLIMLNNHEGKTKEMILSCSLNSERTRWMEAVTPPISENLNEKIYEEWDCPQVQCIENYQAQQPDELSLEEADVVNVFRKMADGWYEGERIRDGTRGWFPSKHVVEIISSHIRARNLRQRYRLLVLTHSLVEEQLKSQQKKKSNR
ncbi:uncharacterized protein LOC143250508 isoform X2 [Tachypleus tridentatus]|uniref:uncharacterized protein LOC143250508 isoform X2 n=1 Tax=Tachypleus tridentatus TaxID=6853 RepID=UPI003FD4FD43